MFSKFICFAEYKICTRQKKLHFVIHISCKVSVWFLFSYLIQLFYLFLFCCSIFISSFIQKVRNDNELNFTLENCRFIQRKTSKVADQQTHTKLIWSQQNIPFYFPNIISSIKNPQALTVEKIYSPAEVFECFLISIKHYSDVYRHYKKFFIEPCFSYK